jgi:hypothetical protein
LVKLLADAGVKLPKWVKQFDGSKVKTTKNADKLRKNQPKEEPVTEEAPAEEVPAEAAE